MPSLRQMSQTIKVFSIKEKILFFVFLFAFILSAAYLIALCFCDNIEVVPDFGGEIREGIVGQPQHINPVYSSVSDVDSDLVELIFSGLMKYDKNGQIVPDLIEEYGFEENGKILNFKLKEGVLWQDKAPLTMDDIVFTLSIIQDTEYLSPIRANFQGVSLEKISDTEGKFKLIEGYSGFLENLTELKIIPKHVFEGILPQDLASDNNLNLLNVIGSGPYMIEKIKKNGSVKFITLKANKFYYGEKPYIERISIYFYGSEEELKTAFQKGSVDLAHLSQASIDNSHISFLTPNYFALFLNTQNELLKKESIREALSIAIDKEELISEILNGEGNLINSPILPYFYENENEESIYDPETASEILEANDFVLENGERKQIVETAADFSLTADLRYGDTGKQVEKLQECLSGMSDIYEDGTISSYFGEKTKEAVIGFQEKYADEILSPANLEQGNGIVGTLTREKLNEICFPSERKETLLELNIKTTNHSLLTAAAKNIKDQLSELGIKINIETYNNNEIKNIIRERDYDILLFGEKLGAIRNPLPYWHSTQIFDPGLNLSLWENEEADELLEGIRIEENFEDLMDFSELFNEDNPAIMLYSPNYIYYINDNKIRGVSSGKIISAPQRYSDIENWYIKTKKIWK